MSPLLRLYLAFSQISGPLWRFSHRRRLKKGKEIADRLPEKYGYFKVQRPQGEVLWFHALSVGESLALIPLIERALSERPKASVVLTTSTASSQQALKTAMLPDRCQHILLPIDTPNAVRRFLDHWRPDLAAFAELDFWPRLMIETKRRDIPMVLINSRMPEHNFKRRRKLRGMIRDVLGLFDRLVLQDDESVQRFVKLGADVASIQVVGVLKSAARPLSADAEDLRRLQITVGDRPVWLAAATVASEHEAIIVAHEKVVSHNPDALMIIAPRHVADGSTAVKLARKRFDQVGQRSVGDDLSEITEVYVADTIGEMGLWYRLAQVSFLGHSLPKEDEYLEGKNPFEAVALGSAVLHGPAVSYFAESYAALAEEGGACETRSSEELAREVLALQDNIRRAAMVQGAKKVIGKGQRVLDETWAILEEHLPN